ncbi:MAG: AAA family ATPase [Desulfuromonadales bacterium]
MDTPQKIHFGPFRFDPISGELSSKDRCHTLYPKDSLVLACLLSKAGELVTKQELMAAVWEGVVVTEGVIKASIKRLRRALNDDSQNSLYISTAHRRGYRFTGRIDPPFPGSHLAPDKSQPRSIVGRGRESELLWTAFRQAAAGRAQLVFVSGEPGIGKSALVEQFAGAVQEEAKALFVRGCCSDTQGPGEAYGPLFEIMEGLARQIGYARLGELMHQYAPMWLLQLPWLLQPGDRELLVGQLLGTTGDRMLRELSMLFEVLSRDQVLVMILEDLHWSDEATLDSLEVFARRSKEFHLLILATYRPNETDNQRLQKLCLRLSLMDHCSEITLPLLTASEIDQYLDLGFPGRIRPDDLAGWFMRYTEGNPLFLTALVSHALERNWLSVNQETILWQEPVADDISWSVPNTLREVIAERFERLPERAQHYLELASIVGMNFPTRVLCVDPALEEVELDELFQHLTRSCGFISSKGLVNWPDFRQSPHYAFVHAWYRQVIYDRIPLLRKQQLHHRIGLHLETLFGEFIHRIAPTLALHFELGRGLDKAITYRRIAGEIALQRHAYQEVEAHINRGLTLLGSLADQRQRHQHELALRVVLGSSLLATRGYNAPQVRETFTRALVLSGEIPGSASLLTVYNGLWIYYLVRTEFAAAAEIIDRFVSAAEQADSREDLAYANFMDCLTCFYQGQFEASQRAAEQCLAICEPAGLETQMRQYGFEPRSASLAHGGLAKWCLGFPEQGSRDVHEALNLSDRSSSPLAQATVLVCAIWLNILRHDVNQAMTDTDRLIGLNCRHGLGYFEFHGRVFKGYLLAVRGESQAGLEQLEIQMKQFESSGAQLLRTLFSSLLIDAYRAAGNLGKAQMLLNAGLQENPKDLGQWSEAEFLRIEGDLLCNAVAPDYAVTQLVEKAENCYQQALAVARQQRARSFELRAALGLSELWVQQNKLSEARQLLTEVYSSFSEGFETGDLVRARDLLEGLVAL